jgi:hypothetical protein
LCRFKLALANRSETRFQIVGSGQLWRKRELATILDAFRLTDRRCLGNFSNLSSLN